jgi:hypothetical protein
MIALLAVQISVDGIREFQYSYTLSFISIVLDNTRQGRHNAAESCPERWKPQVPCAFLTAYAKNFCSATRVFQSDSRRES